MGPIQSFEDLWSFLRRRTLSILLLAILGSVAAVVLAERMSQTYEAAAMLQMETPRVRDDWEATRATAAQRLQLIEQRLMLRENLIGVIERNGLFPDLPAAAINDKIRILRASTSVQSSVGVAGNALGGAPSVSSIVITVRMADAAMAARVANDLAKTVLDQGSIAAEERANERFAFFRAEEKRIAEGQEALEAEIAAYKAQHADALPTQVEARRYELSALRSSIEELDRSLAELESELSVLQASQPVRELSRRRRIEEITPQIAVMKERRAALEDRRAALETALAQVPEIERGLGAYQRRMDQFAILRQRLAEAETDQRLDSERQSERFALVEPAIVPDQPDGSRAKKIMLAGIAASIGLSVTVAFLRDMIFPVLRSSAQMERMLGIRPIVAIPEVPPLRRRRRTT